MIAASKYGASRSIRRLGPLIVAALLAIVVCAPARLSAAESLIGKPAPPFTRSTLQGGKIRLRSLRGKVVLLNFWATWCAPCQVEMPTFIHLQRQYALQGFQVVGISMDDDPALARALLQKLNIAYPVAMGDEYLGELYGGVLGLPLTYLIDRNGVVRARFQGESDTRAIEARIKALLAPH